MPTIKITKGQLRQIIRESYDDTTGYNPRNTRRDAIVAVRAAIVAVREAGAEVGKMMYNENEGMGAFEKLNWMGTELEDLERELQDLI